MLNGKLNGKRMLTIIHEQTNKSMSTHQHIDWSDTVIKIITNAMNVPCNTPAPPEFIFKLLAPAASHNLTAINWVKHRKQTKTPPSAMDQSFDHPTNGSHPKQQK